jgi:hypothetical protein
MWSNQPDALCIFSLFSHYTSTWFGLASIPSSGGNYIYIYIWQLERVVRLSWMSAGLDGQSTKPYSTWQLSHIYIVTSWWWANSKPETTCCVKITWHAVYLPVIVFSLLCSVLFCDIVLLCVTVFFCVLYC